MKIIKLLGITAIIVFIVLAIVKRESINQYFNKSAITPINESIPNNHGDVDQSEKPFYQGEVMLIEHGGAYSYLEIKEKTDETFWIAAERLDAKVGDTIRFKNEMVAKDFKSKALNRTFPEIMFVSNVEHKVTE